LGSGNGFLGVCLVTAVAVAAANDNDDNDDNDNNDDDTEIDAKSNWPGIEVVVTDTAEHLQLMKTTIESNLKRILPKILQDRRQRQQRQQQSKKKSAARKKKTKQDDINNGDDDDDDDDEAPRACDIDIEKIASVKEYLWGENYDFGNGIDNNNNNDNDDNNDNNNSFDLIVGSDVAYRDHLLDPLIKALKEFSKPQQTIALIGVTMNDTKPIFFEKLTQEGFRYEKLADHLFDTEFSTCSRQFGIFVISRTT